MMLKMHVHYRHLAFNVYDVQTLFPKTARPTLLAVLAFG